jgi:hypothetical protein
VLAADVFDSFLREFVREEWLNFHADTRDIATKAKTRSKDDGGDYSIAERAETVCKDLIIDDPVRIGALDLLVKWRNLVAHNADQTGRLSSERQKTLTNAAADISDKYSHLDITLALRNFSARRPPVPKEVTSLIAIATNFSRKLDQAAIQRVAFTSDKTILAAEEMLRQYFNHGLRAPGCCNSGPDRPK